jgi:hypothetical protein
MHQGEGYTANLPLKGELAVFVGLRDVIGAVPRSERATSTPTVESRHPRNDRGVTAELTSVDVETRVASRDSHYFTM